MSMFVKKDLGKKPPDEEEKPKAVDLPYPSYALKYLYVYTYICIYIYMYIEKCIYIYIYMHPPNFAL